MSATKSTIKSKKQKLQQKRQRKGVTNTNVIDIFSSEEEVVQEIIEKKRQNNRPINNNQFKINNFDWQKFKRIEIEPKRFPVDECLVVVETGQTNQESDKQLKSLISYKVQGNDTIRYVSGHHFNNRLASISNQLPLPIKAIPNSELDNQSQKQQKKEYKPSNSRYFDEIAEDDGEERAIKCFRCNKRGHIAKNCLLQAEKARCIYCLGQHQHYNCTSRSCFKCNELGHVSQECKSVGERCRRCNKKGHIERNCGVLIFMDYHKSQNEKELRDKYDSNDLKKLRCLNNCKSPSGHFNCFQYYSNQRTQPYQDEYTSKKKQHKHF